MGGATIIKRMERQKFLKSIGIGAAFALTYGCLGACSKDEKPPFIAPNGSNLPSNTPLFTIDLNSTEASELSKDGGFMIKDDVVIAKSLSGAYLAATVICSHESRKEITFQENEFFCGAHGARFDQSGIGLNNFGTGGLKIYNTQVADNLLTILT